MDQGTAGLVGVLVGGLIGVVGTLGSTRLAGREQRQSQHEHWRRQQRRDAYSQLVSQTSEAIRVGSRATDAYEDDEPNASDLMEQFCELAPKLDAPMSLVALEGPARSDSAALELVGAVRVWANSLSLAIATNEGQYMRTAHMSVGIPEVLRHKESSYEALDAFTQLCRQILDD